MSLEIRRYSEGADQWNALVASSNEGTLFHRLDFLSYHGERFRESEHHLGIYRGQTLVGVMPMAVLVEGDQQVAKSPYGGSFGGPALERPLNYSDSLSLAAAMVDYFRSLGIDRATIRLPYSACYRCFSETFRLALLEHGFQCTNRDICNAVPLTGKPVSETITARARTTARKALKSGIETVRRASLADFWGVLQRNYAKLGVAPTHTLPEFESLHRRFPSMAFADVAYLKGTPIAGIGYLTLNDRVNSSFYLCQDQESQQLGALSLLIQQALEASRAESFHWFDFGTSSANMRGRPNLFLFKESFGALGFFRETYEWSACTAPGNRPAEDG